MLWIGDFRKGPRMIWIRRHLSSEKSARSVQVPTTIEIPGMGMRGKRPRGAALATAVAVDMTIVQAHAQWWNPALKPQVEASQYLVVQGIDGAISV